MKEITIQITEAQEKYLKLFAEKHHPGSDDNLGTHNPIHTVQVKRYKYIPYSKGNEIFYEGQTLVFSLDGYHWHDSETELLEEYFLKQVAYPEIKSFREVQYQVFDGGKTIIEDYEDYFKAYGIESVEIAWREESYYDVAFFLILEEARRYMQYQKHNLKEPRTYTSGAGYANKGEYHHFWGLLFSIGKQLSEEDAKCSPAEIV